MSREDFLGLAKRGHRVPIATDLVLRAHLDAEAILADGARLGAVIAEAARAFDTPLALPLMDLRLEKAELAAFAASPTLLRTGSTSTPRRPSNRWASGCGGCRRHLPGRRPGRVSMPWTSSLRRPTSSPSPCASAPSRSRPG